MEIIDNNNNEDQQDPINGKTTSSFILERQSEYHAQRLKRPLSPERNDAFDQQVTILNCYYVLKTCYA